MQAYKYFEMLSNYVSFLARLLCVCVCVNFYQFCSLAIPHIGTVHSDVHSIFPLLLSLKVLCNLNLRHRFLENLSKERRDGVHLGPSGSQPS